MNNEIQTKKINIFGTAYNVFSESCCSQTPKRTLYIDLLNICNAKCNFCSSSCNLKVSPKTLDLFYAEKVILELIKVGAIDKISLTGGEPLLYPHLEELLIFLDSLVDNGLEFYAITTNGVFLPYKKEILENSKVKYINISRHHYNQAINDKVFGIKTLDINNLKKTIYNSKKTYRLNATITDALSKEEDIFEYINFAKKIGVKNILFRKEYKEGKNTQFIDELFSTCLQCKKSTKCECRIKYIDDINVEYRQVDVLSEHKNETCGNYIRNFVLKNDNRLLAGWSEESKKIF